MPVQITGAPLGGALFQKGGFKLPFLVTGGMQLVFVPLVYMLMRHKMVAPRELTEKDAEGRTVVTQVCWCL